MFIWLLGDASLFSTKNEILASFLTRVIYIGISAIPINIYFFVKNITKSAFKNIWILWLAYLLVMPIIFKTNLIVGQPNVFFWGFYPKAGFYHWLYLIMWASLFVVSTLNIYNQISKYKIINDGKKRLQYSFWALAVGGILGSLDFIQKYGIELYPFGYFCVPAIVCLITYAIVKHNLMDINIAVRKGFVYSILIAAITAIYLLLIMVIEYLFREIIGYRSIIVSLISAFIIAIIFNPLRSKIQNFIDRVFMGKLPQEIVLENTLLKQEVERSERLKTASTLALGLCHEIKNPLTTIRTFAEFLPEKYKDEDFVKKFAKLIPSEVERINSIIKQLLDFSKPAPPSFRNTNIHQLINEVLIFLNSEFLKKHIKVEGADENLSLSIKIDPPQIKQALLNIILNAMEAMPKGGVLHISTQVGRSNYLDIRISDSGCGIPKEDLKQIFDPFFTNKDSGTGLGLAITHQIIKNHNGSIEVESTLDKGTTFTIKLPLERLEG